MPNWYPGKHKYKAKWKKKATTTKNGNPGFENQAVKRAKSEMQMELKTQYPRNRTPGNTL